jgi:hypothetical protein
MRRAGVNLPATVKWRHISPSDQGKILPVREAIGREPSIEPGAEGKPQLVVPGTERISTAEFLRRRAAEPLRATQSQEIPRRLFGDLLGQTDLLDAIRKSPSAARPFGRENPIDRALRKATDTSQGETEEAAKARKTREFRAAMDRQQAAHRLKAHIQEAMDTKGRFSVDTDYGRTWLLTKNIGGTVGHPKPAKS